LTWLRREISDEEIAEFNRKRSEYDIRPLIIHVPYLPNLATSNEGLFRKSIEILIEETLLSGRLNSDYLVFHPGAYSLTSNAESGLLRISNALNLVLDKLKTDVMLLLENVSGGGRRLGSTFEELKFIMDNVNKKGNIGICLDTAHLISAGYEFSDKKKVHAAIEELNKKIGINRVKVIHLNDSYFPCGSKKDRHQHIAGGHIGPRGFKAILNHPELKNIPMILETPKDSKDSDKHNLNAVRKLINK
jgi:deoxyribonuclease-4